MEKNLPYDPHAQELETIRRWTGGLAHDLNNMLTSVLMAAKLLRQERSKNDHDDLVATILTSAERGAALVNQLEAFATGADGEAVAILDCVPGQAADVPESLRRGNGELILVVDDEAPLLALFRATLEGSGYQVMTAASGAQALDIYRTRRATIQVVIVDIVLPGMDGFAIMAAMREMNPAIRMIVSTCLREPKILAKARALGCKGFLPKPFENNDQVHKVVYAVLQADD